MNKTWIIAQREFTSRVRKKTFLLTTILLPILFAGFYFAIIYFSVKGDQVQVIVADRADVFQGNLKNDGDANFTFFNTLEEKQLEDSVRAGKYAAYLYVPENFNTATDPIKIRSGKALGAISKDRLEKRVDTKLKEKKMLAFVSKAQLDSAQQEARFDIQKLDAEDKKDKTTAAYIVGYIAGFLIYIVLFIYGTMVMRGVMEEKVNRIAEVIVSSVKPFQLMMGKILGIGAVGLVQFLIWIVLGLVIQAILPVLSGQEAQTIPQMSAAAQQMPEATGGIWAQLDSLNIPLILFCFGFYFLGGYLLYSSLFAAVGSAVNEDPQDAQSLMLPITMPIIFAIVIMTKAVNDPTSGLAVFGSLFPLTSPVVMMARIAHGVPDGVSALQLILSMVFLIIGFLGTTWLAGKIYRTGILLYGKKVTWKEMWKWAFRKN